MAYRRLAIGVAGLVLWASPAAPQQSTIQVAVNSAELIQLKDAPGSVLVANPAIADIVVEGGRQVFILGKSPGETQLYVLDGSGGTMVRAVVSVVPQTARHMTIIRGEDQSQVHCAPRCTVVGGADSKKPAGAVPGSSTPSQPPAQ